MIIKYPSPHKKQKDSENSLEPSNYFTRWFCNIGSFISIVAIFIGLYLTVKQIFIQTSVQGTFNSILLVLGGITLFYIFSHDRFISNHKKD